MSSNGSSDFNFSTGLPHKSYDPDHRINTARSSSFTLGSIDKLHHLLELLHPPRLIENEALLRGITNENFSETFRLECAISLLKNIADLMQYKIDSNNF